MNILIKFINVSIFILTIAIDVIVINGRNLSQQFWVVDFCSRVKGFFLASRTFVLNNRVE